jgi:hypothetical protein
MVARTDRLMLQVEEPFKKDDSAVDVSGMRAQSDAGESGGRGSSLLPRPQLRLDYGTNDA